MTNSMSDNIHKKYSIEIKNIGMKFGDKKVLEDIELKIAEGEIIGLLGPSGAGKTTLIKILTGQLRQSEGEACILGENTRKLSSHVYTKIGMVMDNAGLYERLSCYDNLELFAKIYGIPTSKIAEALTQVGLGDAKKCPAAKLSKGMRQRLVLARALLHSPQLLFLDEPTSGLDPATALEIHELIRAQQKKGTTIFLTTHNMEEAAKLCDHVALLHEGHIVEYGKPEEICRRYNHQNRVHILLKDGQLLNLNNSAQAAEQISDCFAQNLVETIHSSEPNLETVFMELTGRRFQ